MEPRFVILQDDSGHYYIIPEECADHFARMLEDGVDDEWDAFERCYGPCRLGSHLGTYTFGRPLGGDGLPVFAVDAAYALRKLASLPSGKEQENSEQ